MASHQDMFVYPPICRLIVWEEIQETIVAAQDVAARAGPVHQPLKPWTPEEAQERLMAVIKGNCCFNCFQVCKCALMPRP